MAQLDRLFNGLLISPSALIPKGKQLLWNNGRPTICTDIGDPIEDAVCDHIQFNPEDFERVKSEMNAAILKGDG